MGAIMGLVEELTLAEGVTPLMAFRCKSFDVAGMVIDFESVADVRPPVIAAEAGQFTKRDYHFRSLIGLANAGNAAS
jgi:hypothetical protein